MEELLENIRTNRLEELSVGLALNLRKHELLQLVHTLRENTSVSSAHIRSQDLDANDVKSILESLECNKFIKSLDLDQNNIGSSADGSIAVRKFLIVNNTLTSLSLDHNALGREGIEIVADGLLQNTTLTCLAISHNSIGPQGVRALSRVLQVNSTLRELRMGGSTFGVQGATDTFFEALSNNKTLKKLDLYGSFINRPNLSIAVREMLRRNFTLKELNLDDNSLKGDDIERIVEGLKENQSLQSLSVANNDIEVKGVRALCKAVSLKHLDVGRTQLSSEAWTELCDHLPKSVTFLSLRFNFPHEEGLEALCRMIERNTSLANLDISNNYLKEEGGKKLAKSLYLNHSLKRLFLFSNSIGRLGEAAVVSALENNGTLIDCPCQCRGIDALCQRNQDMHTRAAVSIVAFVCIRRWNKALMEFPKDIVQIIAKMLWITKCDLQVWRKK